MDKDLLTYTMRKANVSRERLCSELNMSPSSFSKKVNEKVDFKLGEVIGICDMLGIEDPRPIFFTPKVS